MKTNKIFKRLLIIAVATLMLLSVASIVNAAYVEIGNPASTTYQSFVPFYGFYDYGWSAVIYLQSELGSSKVFNGLTYDVYFQGLYTIYDQRIWMKHTTDADWVGNFAKPDPVAEGYTLVYEGDITFTGPRFTDTISFDTDFSYDGASNLIIYWENWDGDYQSGQPRWYYPGFNVLPNRAKYRYADNSMPGDATSASSYVPNTRIHYAVEHDVGVKEIVSPGLSEGYGNIPVQVKVFNGGLNCESFDVQVTIDDTTVRRGPFFEEDFSSDPTDWTITHTSGTAWTWDSYYEQMENSWGFPNAGYLDSPVIDCTMVSGTRLSFWHEWYATYPGGTQNGYVRGSIDGGSTFPYLIAEFYDQTSDSGVKEYDISSWADGQANVVIRFDVYNYDNLWWYIDDVVLSEFVVSPFIYDETLTVSNLCPGEEEFLTFPDWVVSTSGTYEIVATTLLATDENPDNDMKMKTTVVGEADAAFVSIDHPASLMGPTPISPKATVENLGEWDFLTTTIGKLPVRATIPDPSGGTGLVFEEHFEGVTGVNQYDGTVDIIMGDDEFKHNEFVGRKGTIRWPEGSPQLSRLGAPSAWTILDVDGDGITWHPTTYRASPDSPVQSMYHGRESNKLYPPSSQDLMISPPIHVGPNGGSFGFDLWMQVEAGWDYLMFGASPDGVSFTWFWFGPISGWTDWVTASNIPIFPWSVDASGYTYIGFYFLSDSIINYEGCYIDNVKVYGSPYLYDETVYVNLYQGETVQIEFPEFTPLDDYHDYELTVCTTHPMDSVPANDCGSFSFNTNAPVYNTRTGFGYATIQAAIDDPETLDGDTIVAQDGTFNEDVSIYKSLTVMGKNPPTSTSIIHGTVSITADDTTFMNFVVWPLDVFDDHGAAIFINANNVVVTDNIVKCVEGLVVDDMFTIKGIHVYATPSDPKQNIIIRNNIIEDIFNDGDAGSGLSDRATYDFEDDDGGWIPTATWDPVGDWEWTNTYDYNDFSWVGGSTSATPPPSAYSGTGLWGTIINACHTNSGGFSYLTKTFDFSDVTAGDATMSWWSWEDVFGSFDYCQLRVNGDLVWGPSWDYSGTTWKQRAVDLSAYAGLSSVTIQFEMWATTVVNYAGWYIDDVTIPGVEDDDDDDDDDDPEPTTYGGATGIMIQGSVRYVDVIGNDVIDVRSAGWSYGIEVTETNLPGEWVQGPPQGYDEVLIFEEGFEDATVPYPPTGWLVEDTNGDGYISGSWAYRMWGTYSSSFYAHSGTKSMRYAYNFAQPADDWVFTHALSLDAGTTYKLEWYDRVQSSSYTERMEVFIGTGQSSGAMTTQIYDDPSMSHTIYELQEVIFTVPTSGTYYIGFHAYSIAGQWNIFIDDVALYGLEEIPGDAEYYPPYPQYIIVEGNYVTHINEDPDESVYPGVMVTIEPGVDPELVKVRYNIFDPDCKTPVYAIINKNMTGGILDASNNWYGYPNGPGGPIADPVNGMIADGFGAYIVDLGNIHFAPWIGVESIASAEPVLVEAGTPVVFTGSESWVNKNVYEVPDLLGDDGDVLFSEDFTGVPTGSIPTGWTRTHTNWGVNPTSEAGGTSPELRMYWSPSANTDFRVTTPAIDTSGYDEFELQFKHYLNHFGGPYTLKVQVSTDGSTWDTLQEWVNPTGFPATDVMIALDDSAYASETFYLSFLFSGDSWNVNWWNIDNIVLTGSGEAGPDWDFDYVYPGLTTPDNYHWKFDDGMYSFNVNPTHIYNAPGTYKGYLRVHGNNVLPEYWGNMMFNWDYFTIQVYSPGAPLSANADDGNLGGYETSIGTPVQLFGSANGGTLPYTYHWDFGVGESENKYDQNPVVHFNEAGTYTVTLTVTDGDDNTATDTAEVVVLGIDELFVSINVPKDAAPNNIITFSSTVKGGVAPYSYHWDFGDGTHAISANPWKVYVTEGVYTVTLTVTDANNDQIVKSATIDVQGEEEHEGVTITNVKGGLMVSATIRAADTAVQWSIEVDGRVFIGGSASGTIPAGAQSAVRLPFTVGFGKVDVTITANDVVESYTAFALGPFFLNLQ